MSHSATHLPGDDEDKYGPSIYSVNEQYIKPVTADAGKMSWALMMNPEGLDCDLFVSHAWQEGEAVVWVVEGCWGVQDFADIKLNNITA